MRAAAWPVYYGWLVLAASAISEFLVQGATSYSAGLFVLPLQAEFHISRADANSSILLLFVGVVMVSPFVGRILDAWPVRLVMAVGVALFSLSLAAISFSSSLWLMAVILVVPAAIGYMCLGFLMTSTLVARWFYRRRGLALGIAAVATSGGGFVVVPLLSQAILRHGWRMGLLCEAIVLGVVILVLTFTVLRDRPAQMGLDDHSENRGRPAAKVAAQGATWRWKEILSSRAFWIPALAVAAVSGTCQATVITLFAYGMQLGFAATAAALLISAFAISAGITKVAAGLLADHINQRYLLIAAALLMTLSWLTLSLLSSYGAVFAGSCLAGVALGCALPTSAGFIAAHFGSARFGGAMGWAYALTAAVAILSVRFVGAMYDLSGGYALAFRIFAVLLALVSAVLLLLKPQRAGLVES